MKSSTRYWLNEVKDLSGFTVLSEMRIAGNASDTVKQYEKRVVPADIYTQIVKLSKNSPSGIYVCFLSAFHLLLKQFESGETIITRMPSFKESNEVVSLPLFIRSVPSDTYTVREYLNIIREKFIEAYRNRLYDNTEMTEDPMYSVFKSVVSGDGISLLYQELHIVEKAEKNDSLTLTLQQEAGNHEVHFTFNSAFLPGFATCFADQFVSVLQIMFADVDILLKDVVSSLHLAHAYNPSFVSFTLPDETILSLFKKQLALQPEVPAVFWNGKKDSLTYKELDERSGKFAARLKHKYSLSKGEVVAIFAPTSPEFLVICWGIIKAGGIVLMIEETQPETRVQYMLQKCQSRFLITDHTLKLENILSISLKEGLSDDVYAGFSDCYESTVLNPDDTVFVTFTSGSTGEPKGVMLTHKNMVNQFEWFASYFHYTAADVMPQKSSISFVDALTELYFPITRAGSAVYLRPYESINKNSHDLVSWFTEIEATVILYVPSLFSYVSSVEDFSKIRSLKHLVLGGEDIKGVFNYPFAVYNLYGNSECSSISSIYNLNEKVPWYKIPIGKPIFNTRMLILNEYGRTVPLFMKGEIYIGGYGVGPGYINDTTFTQQKFIPDSDNPEMRLYKTGDFGRFLLSGDIEYFGRKDNEIKIRGIRIDTSEVENRIRTSVAGVKEIAVLVIGDNSEKYLAAICKTDDTVTGLTESFVKKQLLAYLPTYMLPADWLFVEEMPFTVSGKLDRKKAASMVMERRKQDSLPSDETEKHILTIWERVLNRTGIGVTDNFFRSGGQSLSMVYVLSQIKRETGFGLTMDEFIIDPTIRGLADKIRNGKLDRKKHTTVARDIIQLNKDNGQKLTMIMLHPFNGFAYYYSLGSELEKEIKLYGMNIPGIGPDYIEPMVPDTYGDIAALYSEKLLQSGLLKKFVIAGYSASIPLAFEIVKILEAKNISPTKLLLVDDYFKASDKVLQDEEMERMLNSELYFAASKYLNLNLENKRFKESFDLSAVYAEYCLQKLNENHITEENLETYIMALRKMFRLQLSHKPSGFIMTDAIYLYSEKYGSFSGWEPYIKGNYSAVQLQGPHAALFEGENVSVNARTIFSILQ
jgi:amino acid adenylation domain-containing protein